MDVVRPGRRCPWRSSRPSAKVLKECPELDRPRFHCDPERPAVDCPTPLGHHRWEFPLLPGEDRDEVSGEAYIWKLLARHGITPEHVEILRRAVYVHHVRFAKRWREGRVFGDAAHRRNRRLRRGGAGAAGHTCAR